jgi:hypothetical protein
LTAVQAMSGITSPVMPLPYQPWPALCSFASHSSPGLTPFSARGGPTAALSGIPGLHQAGY